MAKKKLNLPAEGLTIDEILERKEAATVDQPICLVWSLVEARDEAALQARQAERERLRHPDDPSYVEAVEDAEAALEEAQESMLDQSVVFRFQSIGRQGIEDLMKAHPPTQKQIQKHHADLKAAGLPTNKKLQYNDDTFPYALLAAASVTPAMDEEQAERLWNGQRFGRAELARLFDAAWSVNNVIAN